MWDTKSCRDLFISRGVSYLFFCLTILWVGPLHDRDVHVNDLELVRPRYLQGRLQDVEELTQMPAKNGSYAHTKYGSYGTSYNG